MSDIFLALEALHQRYRNLWHSEHNSLPVARFDDAWPSACAHQQKKEHASYVYHWQATSRRDTALFSPIEQALECTIHPDIKAYYGSFWADSIPVEHRLADCLLLQIWNEEDQQRLLENQLGHAFARIKGRLPLTFFIACTHSDTNICLDNQTGEIVLERPGYPAQKVLADSLESFLLDCAPCLDDYGA